MREEPNMYPYPPPTMRPLYPDIDREARWYRAVKFGIEIIYGFFLYWLVFAKPISEEEAKKRRKPRKEQAKELLENMIGEW